MEVKLGPATGLDAGSIDEIGSKTAYLTPAE